MESSSLQKFAYPWFHHKSGGKRFQDTLGELWNVSPVFGRFRWLMSDSGLKTPAEGDCGPGTASFQGNQRPEKGRPAALVQSLGEGSCAGTGLHFQNMLGNEYRAFPKDKDLWERAGAGSSWLPGKDLRRKYSWMYPTGGLPIKDVVTRDHLEEPVLCFSASPEVAWPSTKLSSLLWDSS